MPTDGAGNGDGSPKVPRAPEVDPADDDDDDDDPFAHVRANPGETAVKTVASPAAVPDLPTLALPARLGRYLLQERLGVGGMAEVYRAVQEGPAGFNKTVVVKRILPHLADRPRFVEMFLSEARVAATFTHSNIVQLYELGEVNSVYFIAMEHVDGLSVFQVARRAWRRKRSLPLPFVAHTIADAARGLDYAYHSPGADGQPRHLVHRDISPDNLMINGEGVTKVLDFGVARSRQSARTTRTGELKGKVPFMAPEQLHGQDVDHRCDLYALGVTMYWLLTGKRPFVGATDLLLMQAIVGQEPRPPIELNPSIPPALNDLVLALLSKDRDARPERGNDVARELHGLVPGDRSTVAAFVGDISQEAAPGGDGPAKTTSGFLPATPMTTPATDLVSAKRAAREKSPVVAATPTVATAAGPAMRAGRRRIALVAAVATPVALAVLFLATRAPAPAVTAPAPVPTNAPAATAPAATAPAVAAATDETPDPDVQPATPPAPAASAAAPDQPDVKAGELRARRANVQPAIAPAIARQVEAVAPPDVRWSTLEGAPLGSGTRTLADLPRGATVIVAVDPHTGGRSRVPIVDGRADYGALGRGTLSVRAFPYAEVFLGERRLGSTPLAPLDVVEGSYQVRFVHEDRTLTRETIVTAGGTAKVKADFIAE